MKTYISLTKRIFFLLVFSLCIYACGSSSGSDQAVIRVLSPEADTAYYAGELINFEIETINFKLTNPNTVHVLYTSKNLGEMGNQDHSDHEDSIAENGEADHDLSTSNPQASEGHYHVYLDAHTGSDEHLTSWEKTGSFQLPDDIGHGTHSLRFELRDNHHRALGTSTSEAILFFEIH